MSDRLVTVARFAHAHEARQAAAFLEEEGIRSSLSNELMVATADYLSNAVGGVPIQVMEKDAERAAKLLAEEKLSRQAKPETDEESPARPDSAPDEEDEADEEDKPLAPCDEAIRNAYRAATMGLMFLPFIAHLYSAWCLIQAGRLPGEHDPKLDGKLKVALAIDAVVLGIPLLILIASFLVGR